VDATIIAAPPSTKNRAKARDPEMHQTKNGNEWHFDMKAHIAYRYRCGLAKSAEMPADRDLSFDFARTRSAVRKLPAGPERDAAPRVRQLNPIFGPF